MKHFVWLSWLILIALPAKAQMQPGRLLVGAELNQLKYERTGSGDYTSSKALITPSFSYCIERNLTISLGVPLGTSSSFYHIGGVSLSSLNYRQTQTRIGLAPSIRYYFGESNLKPFIGFTYSYLVNQNTDRLIENSSEVVSSSFSNRSNLFMPSIGIAYSLSQKLVLITSLNYFIDINDSKRIVASAPNTTPDTVRPNSKSLSAGLGIQVFLGK